MNGLPNYAFYEGNTGAIPVAHSANTPARLELASKLGYIYAEVDGAATSDDVLVAFHGPSLWQKLRPGPTILDELGQMTFAEVQAADPEIVSQEELMATFPDMRFFIDIKTARAVRPLSRLITKLSLHDRVSVGGSDWSYPSAVREQAGQSSFICTTLGTATGSLALAATRLDLSAAEERLSSYGATEFALPVVMPTTTERAHRLGMRTFNWTPNRERRIASALAKGVDGVMSDEFELLKSLTDRHSAPDS